MLTKNKTLIKTKRRKIFKGIKEWMVKIINLI